jgi:hypothetical protein
VLKRSAAIRACLLNEWRMLRLRLNLVKGAVGAVFWFWRVESPIILDI